MPVTIHYNGKLDNRARLAELLDAARLYCAEQRWMYRDVEESIVGHVERLNVGSARDAHGEIIRAPIDDALEGILIIPNSRTDPLWFTFNNAGYLVAYLPLNEPDEFWERASLSVDTQAAGLETHIALCEFLQTMRDQFMPGLNVYDEANYFESGDIARAERAMDNSGTSGEPEPVSDAPEYAGQDTLTLMGESADDAHARKHSKKTLSGRGRASAQSPDPNTRS